MATEIEIPVSVSTKKSEREDDAFSSGFLEGKVTEHLESKVKQLESGLNQPLESSSHLAETVNTQLESDKRTDEGGIFFQALSVPVVIDEGKKNYNDEGKEPEIVKTIENVEKDNEEIRPSVETQRNPEDGITEDEKKDDNGQMKSEETGSEKAESEGLKVKKEIASSEDATSEDIKETTTSQHATTVAYFKEQDLNETDDKSVDDQEASEQSEQKPVESVDKIVRSYSEIEQEEQTEVIMPIIETDEKIEQKGLSLDAITTDTCIPTQTKSQVETTKHEKSYEADATESDDGQKDECEETALEKAESEKEVELSDSSSMKLEEKAISILNKDDDQEKEQEVNVSEKGQGGGDDVISSQNVSSEYIKETTSGQHATTPAYLEEGKDLNAMPKDILKEEGDERIIDPQEESEHCENEAKDKREQKEEIEQEDETEEIKRSDKKLEQQQLLHVITADTSNSTQAESHVETAEHEENNEEETTCSQDSTSIQAKNYDEGVDSKFVTTRESTEKVTEEIRANVERKEKVVQQEVLHDAITTDACISTETESQVGTIEHEEKNEEDVIESNDGQKENFEIPLVKEACKDTTSEKAEYEEVKHSDASEIPLVKEACKDTTSEKAEYEEVKHSDTSEIPLVKEACKDTTSEKAEYEEVKHSDTSEIPLVKEACKDTTSEKAEYEEVKHSDTSEIPLVKEACKDTTSEKAEYEEIQHPNTSEIPLVKEACKDTTSEKAEYEEVKHPDASEIPLVKEACKDTTSEKAEYEEVKHSDTSEIPLVKEACKDTTSEKAEYEEIQHPDTSEIPLVKEACKDTTSEKAEYEEVKHSDTSEIPLVKEACKDTTSEKAEYEEIQHPDTSEIPLVKEACKDTTSEKAEYEEVKHSDTSGVKLDEREITVLCKDEDQKIDEEASECDDDQTNKSKSPLVEVCKDTVPEKANEYEEVLIHSDSSSMVLNENEIVSKDEYQEKEREFYVSEKGQRGGDDVTSSQNVSSEDIKEMIGQDATEVAYFEEVQGLNAMAKDIRKEDEKDRTIVPQEASEQYENGANDKREQKPEEIIHPCLEIEQEEYAKHIKPSVDTEVKEEQEGLMHISTQTETQVESQLEAKEHEEEVIESDDGTKEKSNNPSIKEVREEIDAGKAEYEGVELSNNSNVKLNEKAIAISSKDEDQELNIEEDQHADTPVHSHSEIGEATIKEDETAGGTQNISPENKDDTIANESKSTEGIIQDDFYATHEQKSIDPLEKAQVEKELQEDSRGHQLEDSKSENPCTTEQDTLEEVGEKTIVKPEEITKQAFQESQNEINKEIEVKLDAENQDEGREDRNEMKDDAVLTEKMSSELGQPIEQNVEEIDACRTTTMSEKTEDEIAEKNEDLSLGNIDDTEDDTIKEEKSFLDERTKEFESSALEHEPIEEKTTIKSEDITIQAFQESQSETNMEIEGKLDAENQADRREDRSEMKDEVVHTEKMLSELEQPTKQNVEEIDAYPTTTMSEKTEDEIAKKNKDLSLGSVEDTNDNTIKEEKSFLDGRTREIEISTIEHEPVGEKTTVKPEEITKQAFQESKIETNKEIEDKLETERSEMKDEVVLTEKMSSELGQPIEQNVEEIQACQITTMSEKIEDEIAKKDEDLSLGSKDNTDENTIPEEKSFLDERTREIEISTLEHEPVGEKTTINPEEITIQAFHESQSETNKEIEAKLDAENLADEKEHKSEMKDEVVLTEKVSSELGQPMEQNVEEIQACRTTTMSEKVEDEIPEKVEDLSLGSIDDTDDNTIKEEKSFLDERTKEIEIPTLEHEPVGEKTAINLEEITIQAFHESQSETNKEIEAKDAENQVDGREDRSEIKDEVLSTEKMSSELGQPMEKNVEEINACRTTTMSEKTEDEIVEKNKDLSLGSEEDTNDSTIKEEKSFLDGRTREFEISVLEHEPVEEKTIIKQEEITEQAFQESQSETNKEIVAKIDVENQTDEREDGSEMKEKVVVTEKMSSELGQPMEQNVEEIQACQTTTTGEKIENEIAEKDEDLSLGSKDNTDDNTILEEKSFLDERTKEIEIPTLEHEPVGEKTTINPEEITIQAFHESQSKINKEIDAKDSENQVDERENRSEMKDEVLFTEKPTEQNVEEIQACQTTTMSEKVEDEITEKVEDLSLGSIDDTNDNTIIKEEKSFVDGRTREIEISTLEHEPIEEKTTIKPEEITVQAFHESQRETNKEIDAKLDVENQADGREDRSEMKDEVVLTEKVSSELGQPMEQNVEEIQACRTTTMSEKVEDEIPEKVEDLSLGSIDDTNDNTIKEEKSFLDERTRDLEISTLEHEPVGEKTTINPEEVTIQAFHESISETNKEIEAKLDTENQADEKEHKSEMKDEVVLAEKVSSELGHPMEKNIEEIQACQTTTISEKIEDEIAEKNEELSLANIEDTNDNTTIEEKIFFDGRTREIEISTLEHEPVEEKNGGLDEVSKEKYTDLNEATTAELQEDFIPSRSPRTSTEDTPNSETSKAESENLPKDLDSVSEVEIPRVVPKSEDSNLKEECLISATDISVDDERGTVTKEISSDEISHSDPIAVEIPEVVADSEESIVKEERIILETAEHTDENNGDEEQKIKTNDISSAEKKEQTTESKQVVEHPSIMCPDAVLIEENLELYGELKPTSELMIDEDQVDETKPQPEQSDITSENITKYQTLESKLEHTSEKDMEEDVTLAPGNQINSTEYQNETMKNVILKENVVVEIEKEEGRTEVKGQDSEEVNCPKELEKTSASNLKESANESMPIENTEVAEVKAESQREVENIPENLSCLPEASSSERVPILDDAKALEIQVNLPEIESIDTPSNDQDGIETIEQKGVLISQLKDREILEEEEVTENRKEAPNHEFEKEEKNDGLISEIQTPEAILKMEVKEEHLEATNDSCETLTGGLSSEKLLDELKEIDAKEDNEIIVSGEEKAAEDSYQDAVAEVTAISQTEEVLLEVEKAKESKSIKDNINEEASSMPNQLTSATDEVCQIKSSSSPNELLEAKDSVEDIGDSKLMAENLNLKAEESTIMKGPTEDKKQDVETIEADANKEKETLDESQSDDPAKTTSDSISGSTEQDKDVRSEESSSHGDMHKLEEGPTKVDEIIAESKEVSAVLTDNLQEASPEMIPVKHDPETTTTIEKIEEEIKDKDETLVNMDFPTSTKEVPCLSNEKTGDLQVSTLNTEIDEGKQDGAGDMLNKEREAVQPHEHISDIKFVDPPSDVEIREQEELMQCGSQEPSEDNALLSQNDKKEIIQDVDKIFEEAPAIDDQKHENELHYTAKARSVDVVSNAESPKIEQEHLDAKEATVEPINQENQSEQKKEADENIQSDIPIEKVPKQTTAHKEIADEFLVMPVAKEEEESDKVKKAEPIDIQEETKTEGNLHEEETEKTTDITEATVNLHHGEKGEETNCKATNTEAEIPTEYVTSSDVELKGDMDVPVPKCASTRNPEVRSAILEVLSGTDATAEKTAEAHVAEKGVLEEDVHLESTCNRSETTEKVSGTNQEPFNLPLTKERSTELDAPVTPGTAATENVEISKEYVTDDLMKISQIQPEQQKYEVSACVVDKQLPDKPYQNEGMESKPLTENIDASHEKGEPTAKSQNANAKDLKATNASGTEPQCSSEVVKEEKKISDEKEKSETPEPATIDILHESTQGNSEVAENLIEEREPAPTKDPQVDKEETGDNGAKTDEEEEAEEDDEDNQKMGSCSDAPVMVEASKDMEVKVHKKSHNILSGVGSKVKHSIAKVKKAITGKSSHPKPPSPKERE